MNLLRIQMIVPLVLLAATCLIAAEPAKRPDVGDFVPSYASTKCGGINDKVPVGKTVCYTCRAGKEPIFYVFAKKPSDALVKLVKQIEALVVSKKEQEAAAVINFLGDPHEEQARKAIADFGVKHDLRNLSLTITGDGEKFGLSDQDEVTVILFENGIIRLRNSMPLETLDNEAVDSIIRQSKTLLN